MSSLSIPITADGRVQFNYVLMELARRVSGAELHPKQEMIAYGRLPKLPTCSEYTVAEVAGATHLQTVRCGVRA